MKKRLLILLLASVVCQGLRAQDMGGSRYLNLVLPDNSLVSYELANGVDIHFQDSIIVVNDLSFYMDNIVKYYFSRGHASTYNITVVSHPIDGGFVSQSGDGTYTFGDTCTLTATANQGYNFVNWTKNDTAVSVSPTYTFTVTESASFVANFIQDQCEITQVANFSQGYNWWSSYIELDDINGLDTLQEALGDNGISIFSQTDGYTDYYPDYGWFGSLTDINNESSYRVITSEPCAVTMTGNAALPSQHPITLNQGWTWIGYVPSFAMDVDAAMAGITPASGDRLKSQHCFADYYLDYGWYGSLNTIEPGMGLMYYSANSETVTFTYPDNGSGGELKANLTAEDNHWLPNTFAYPDNMSMTAVVELNDVELSSEDYELAAFANGDCRGSVRLVYVEPIHRYLAFLTISGDDISELRFSLYNTETGAEIHNAEEQANFIANAIVGSVDEPYTIHFRGEMGIDELPDSPVIGDKLYVRSPNKDGFVVISDLMGRVVYNKKIGETCVIDLSWLVPNTLYVIKVNNQSIKFVRR